ncbi:MAG TPA: tetratricopeptide repeat protein [Vicinamibacterales bacterium]|jgi:tetratricopeptide (TPR) repeat protein|nr:tetratricopeptide repeat protein [Vicinamibacterales bacterium]
MRSDSIVFAVAGMCFGIILGWVIGTQQARKNSATQVQLQQTAPAPSAPAGGDQAAGAARTPPPLDEGKVQSLQTIIKSDPKNAGAYVQLGNAYFDAEKYPDAIKWYEAGLKLDPKNPDASTDLGVSYYYSGRTDDALKQFEHSLTLDPKHAKTLFNKGIVLAFGKRDFDGARQAWQQVVALAPGTPEAQAAQQGLQGIAASQGRGAPPAPPTAPGG